jgi:hypothetical protein
MIIKQKQSLVHKIPSGVVILSHVCGVTVIVLHSQVCYLENIGRQGFLVFDLCMDGMGVST